MPDLSIPRSKNCLAKMPDWFAGNTNSVSGARSRARCKNGAKSGLASGIRNDSMTSALPLGMCSLNTASDSSPGVQSLTRSNWNGNLVIQGLGAELLAERAGPPRRFGRSVAPGVHDRLRQGFRICEAALVTAGNLHQPEQAQFLRQPRMPWIVMGQRRVLRAIDVGFPDLHVRQICLQRNLVGQGLVWMRVENVVGLLCCRRIGVIDESLAPDRERQHHRAVAALGGDLVEQRHIVRRYHIVEAFAVGGGEGVPSDQAAHSIRELVG